MNDRDADLPPFTASSDMRAPATAETTRIPAKRGRPSETPAQRMMRLERQLAEAKIAAKEAERRLFAVVGEAILAEANRTAR